MAKQGKVEVLPKEGKPGPENGPLALVLAVAAVWAVAFVMGLRLRHPIPRAILALMAAVATVAILKHGSRPKED